jgi:predicted nucleotidyltransferase
MNFDVDKRTILLVKHGSHAYGLNTPTSDEDFKGVCIKPRAAYFGFTQRFEQHEHMGSKTDGIDKVVYSLEKFVSLAADCNPSIVEVLHVADEDVVVKDSFGERLRAIRDDFLSRKAKFTFAGYAHGQLKRIKTHRSWLLNPPKAPPTRKEFGLSETSKISKSELGAYDAILEQGIEIELPKDLLTVFTREKQYQASKTHYDQFKSWEKSRNPARAELEAKYGYDTKHGMHLMRLELMGIEILEKHTVHVKWTGPERDYLMGIRNGLLPYDELVERAEKLEARADELYETSTLRREPNRAQLDAIVVDMTDEYLSLYG